MEDQSMIPIIVAALIPTIMGMIYYNPKTFGTAWMNSLGKTEEELKEGFNMALVTIIGLVLSFFLAMSINALVELMHKDVNDAGELIYASHHTFGHGALHGALLAIFFVLPIYMLNGMYERKTWKNMFINAGYWIITLALMSGLMDAWN